MCLELFSGTGSIGRAFERLGWTVVSVDICAKWKPTLVVDILHWDYTVFPRDYFQFVWASPVCTQYSVAKTVGVRDLDGADRLVNKALEIISYFGCNWAFENPQTGLLKTRAIVEGLPYFDTTYCHYGRAYRKATRIWSSLVLSLHQPCTLRNPCSAMIERRHPKTAQQSRRGNDPTDRNNTCTQRELYSIPDGLCDAIAGAANLAVEQSNVSNDQPDARTHVSSPAAFVSEELRSNPGDL